MDNQELLTKAILSNDHELVREALQNGARVDEYDSEGATPLLQAVTHGHTEITRILLDAGADPNKPREDDPSLVPLVAALQTPWSTENLVKLLLDMGARVDIQDEESRTPLILAVSSAVCSAAVIEKMLNLGADPNHADSHGMTALMQLMSDPEGRFVVPKKRREAEEVLKKRGASEEGLLHVKLLLAVEAGEVAKAERLITSGADVNFDFEHSCLETAAEEGNLEMVRMLIAHGADLNKREDEHAFTPLIAAVVAGRSDIVAVLVEAGADIATEVVGVGGPLVYARSGGHTEIADYLLAHGAKDTDLSRMRGVTSFDVNEFALLVKAPVERVSEHFAAVKNAEGRLVDIYDQDMTSTDLCFVVYQLKGHDWTLIQYIHDDYRGDGLEAQDTRRLSSDLRTKALYYANSDTADTLMYALYENGEEIERLEYGEDYSTEIADFLEEASDTAIDIDEADSLPVRFDSTLRQVDLEEVGRNVYDFTNKFIKACDAYVPGWSEMARCVYESGGHFRIADWPKDCFVRVDYVVVR